MKNYNKSPQIQEFVENAVSNLVLEMKGLNEKKPIYTEGLYTADGSESSRLSVLYCQNHFRITFQTNKETGQNDLEQDGYALEIQYYPDAPEKTEASFHGGKEGKPVLISRFNALVNDREYFIGRDGEIYTGDFHDQCVVMTLEKILDDKKASYIEEAFSELENISKPKRVIICTQYWNFPLRIA